MIEENSTSQSEWKSVMRASLCILEISAIILFATICICSFFFLDQMYSMVFAVGAPLASLIISIVLYRLRHQVSKINANIIQPTKNTTRNGRKSSQSDITCPLNLNPEKSKVGQQPAKPEIVPPLEPAQNKGGTGWAKLNKKKFALICFLGLVIFLGLPVLFPTDEEVALAAVENAMRQQDMTPRITEYVFTPNEKGGVLIVEDELINVFTDEVLGCYYYQADVKIDGHKYAKVLSLTKIDYPGNLNWQPTDLGKQRRSEAEDRITKGLFR